MIPQIKSLLGLAQRAGKVYSGESQVEAILKKRKGCLLIIAEDSPRAFDKFGKWASDLGLPVIKTGNKEELGLSIGRSPRSVIIVDDPGFSDAILKKHLGDLK